MVKSRQNISRKVCGRGTLGPTNSVLGMTEMVEVSDDHFGRLAIVTVVVEEVVIEVGVDIGRVLEEVVVTEVGVDIGRVFNYHVNNLFGSETHL